DGGGGGGRLVLQVREAVAFRQHDFAVPDDGEGEAGGVALLHLGADEGVDLGGERRAGRRLGASFLLGGRGRRPGDHANRREEHDSWVVPPSDSGFRVRQGSPSSDPMIPAGRNRPERARAAAVWRPAMGSWPGKSLPPAPKGQRWIARGWRPLLLKVRLAPPW